MKTKSILFSTEMVQAILEGRKTQTRRCVKFANYHPSRTEKHHSLLQVKGFEVYDGNGDHIGNLRDKYGNIGDLLWVRERFCRVHSDMKHKETGKPYAYFAGTDSGGLEVAKEYGFKWKPSIHMPKEASRLFLKIKNIRVEKLRDITEADAIAEGVYKACDYGSTGYKLFTEPDAAYSDIDAIESFESLWESINGKESLESNPWVWVIEFERVEKPENF